jgi:hypothetical protein
VVLAETAVVYSVALLLLIGMIIVGLGVFRYQQVSALAREGARWASVHGPTYQSEQQKRAPTVDDVYTNAISPKVVGLDPAKLHYTLSATSNTVTVTLTYQWVLEGFFFSPVTLTSTSTMPITY